MRSVGVKSAKSFAARKWEQVAKQGPLSGVLTLVAGSAGAQTLSLLAAPVLTRLYSPESFGDFAYMLSVAGIIGSFASLGLELAVPLASKVSDAQKLIRMAMVAATGTALLTAILVWLFHGSLSQMTHFDIMPWAIWVPFLVLLTAWFVVLSEATLRQRAYSAIATRTLAQNVGTVGGQLLLATVTRTAGGLLTGQLFGRSFGIVSLARKNKGLLRRSGRGGYGQTLRANWRFPLVFAPTAVLNTLGLQLPLILLGAWFGIESAGFLGVAQRVTALPAGVIGIAVGQVFCGELTARLRANERNNRRLYLKVSARLGLFGSVIALALLILPPYLFPVILGSNWAEAGAYAQATALAVGLGFMASPLSYVLVAYQKTVMAVTMDISRIVLVCGLGYWAHRSGWSAVSALWMMYAGITINYVLTWFLGLAVTSEEDSSPTSDGGPSALVPGPTESSLDF
jgi:O-antigen/teichoic acid export membrane protein